jgi:hypothetical protein
MQGSARARSPAVAALADRPTRIGAEVRDLIARMARANRTWGAERIRGELLKLGIAVGRTSVQRDRQRGPARPPSQTWATFLRNHRPSTLAADLLTVQTLTFRTLYVLVFVSHATPSAPTAACNSDPPAPRHRGAAPGANRIRARPVLGGLHRVDERVA